MTAYHHKRVSSFIVLWCLFWPLINTIHHFVVVVVCVSYLTVDVDSAYLHKWKKATPQHGESERNTFQKIIWTLGFQKSILSIIKSGAKEMDCQNGEYHLPITFEAIKKNVDRVITTYFIGSIRYNSRIFMNKSIWNHWNHQWTHQIARNFEK